MELGWVTLFS